MQVKRRIGTAGAPPVLAEGQIGYNDPQVAANDDALYIGSTASGSPVIRTLVSSTRQVELGGAQTITGAKTIGVANLKLTGGANNNILTTDGAGNLAWTAAPSGGLLTVATDTTLSGNGTSGDPLSVESLATPRNISLQAAAPAADGSKTVITVTPASFNGTADALMTGFTVSLDDGTY
jgi:hypothetical protein